jgi:hypothetical protein
MASPEISAHIYSGFIFHSSAENTQGRKDNWIATYRKGQGQF